MGVCASTASPVAPMEFQPEKELTPKDKAFVDALNGRNEMFVVADPDLPDCQLVFVSPLFCRITGYQQKEIVGTNCRFLQGEKTDKAHVKIISDAVKNKSEASLQLLNYRKDGTTFHNQFFMSNLHSTDGKHAYFIGVQQEVRESGNGMERQNYAYCFRRAGRYVNYTAEGKNGATTFKPQTPLCSKDQTYVNDMENNGNAIAISEPGEQDNPLVYVSQGMIMHTGYAWEELVGVNCRFLQKNADPAELERLRDALEEEKDVSVCLQNVKKDGTLIWNQFFISPLRDESGKVVYHCSVQRPVNSYDDRTEERNPGFMYRSTHP
ncbi:unnamed protein product [Chrysoparadoxa australica]